MRLESVEDLRDIYRPPGRGPVDKVIHHLDSHCVDFLAKSPFFVLSSSNAAGVCDGSPKGGPRGFVQVLDDKRLGWADFSGNNRLDSFQNVVTNSSVALLFMIPGLDETLRINGHAELVTDPELCQRFAIEARPVRVVVVVTVAEAYIHCAKALRRAGLWATESWFDASQLPSAACIVKDHARLDANVAEIEEARKRDLRTTLWQPGGIGLVQRAHTAPTAFHTCRHQVLGTSRSPSPLSRRAGSVIVQTQARPPRRFESLNVVYGSGR
jgi:PPOX class probable FMN-dependent enzyme